MMIRTNKSTRCYNIVKMSNLFKDNKRLMPIVYMALACIIAKSKGILS